MIALVSAAVLFWACALAAFHLFCETNQNRERRLAEYSADILERVAYRLTAEFTTRASFRDRGRLLPEQAEALSIVINLALERMIEP